MDQDWRCPAPDWDGGQHEGGDGCGDKDGSEDGGAAKDCDGSEADDLDGGVKVEDRDGDEDRDGGDDGAEIGVTVRIEMGRR